MRKLDASRNGEGPLAREWKPYFYLLRFIKVIAALPGGQGFDSEPKGRAILVSVIPITSKQGEKGDTSQCSPQLSKDGKEIIVSAVS